MANSTQLITDMTTVASGTPTATSQTKLNAATGPIQDFTGNANAILTKLKEAVYLIVKLQAGMDSGDALYTTLGNVAATLYANYSNLV